MTISLGATVTTDEDPASTSGTSFTHTVDSGTDLLVLCLSYSSGGTITPSATWDADGAPPSQSLTVQENTAPSSNEEGAILTLLNPSAGSGTIAITLSQASGDSLNSVAFNLSGVDTVTPIGNTGQADGATGVTVNISASTDWLVGGVADWQTTGNLSCNDTEIGEIEGTPTDDGDLNAGYVTGGTGNQTLDWSNTRFPTTYGIEVNDDTAGGGAGLFPGSLALLGAGT